MCRKIEANFGQPAAKFSQRRTERFSFLFSYVIWYPFSLWINLTTTFNRQCHCCWSINLSNWARTARIRSGNRSGGIISFWAARREWARFRLTFQKMTFSLAKHRILLLFLMTIWFRDILQNVQYSILLEVRMFRVFFIKRLVGLGVWFALWVREVPGSNPGPALNSFIFL